jgi:hypothetical protein
MGKFDFDDSQIEPRDKTQPRDNLLGFDDDLAFGYFFKDLVVLLLDKSGYQVYPYGYESFFPNLKRSLRGSSKVVERVRSTPDLLVINSSNNDVYLVEVKARSTPAGRRFRIKGINLYKQFWRESVIVIVLSSGNHFYAQHVSELDNSEMYDLTNFRPLEEVFPKVSELSPAFRIKMVRKAMTLFRARDCGNL